MKIKEMCRAKESIKNFNHCSNARAWMMFGIYLFIAFWLWLFEPLLFPDE